MATVAELQRRQGDLRLLIASFEARLAQRQQQLDQTRRLAAENQDTIPKIQRALARAQAEGDTARAAQIESDLRESQVAAAELSATEAQQRAALEQTQTALNDARQDLAGLETQIRAAADQGPGTESAGDTVAESQTARDDAANTQTPEPEASGNTRATTAQVLDQGADPESENSDPPVTTGDVTAGSNNAVDDDAGNDTLATVTVTARRPDRTATGVRNLQSPRLLYKAITVTNRFSRGQFTQQLEGILLGITPEQQILDQPATTTAASSAPAAGGSAPASPSTNGVFPNPGQGSPTGFDLDRALYSNTDDEDLTYDGDDEIVRERINRQRAARGLSPLEDLPTDD